MANHIQHTTPKIWRIRNISLLAALSALVLGTSMLVGVAHAEGLCPAAEKLWLDDSQTDIGYVLELDNIPDCNQQVQFVNKITDCAGDYIDPKHPVYDQGLANMACLRQYKFAHLYNRIYGKPYSEHEPVDHAHSW